MRHRYIGLDIGGELVAYATILPISGSCETGYMRDPSELAKILRPEDHIAAEWTGGIARPWLETALQITPYVFLYHPAQLKADRKHVGEKEKNDFACARAIAKLLSQRRTNPFQPKYLFVPYATVRESFALRRAIRNARIYDIEIQRIRQIAYFANKAGIEFDANRVINALEEASRQAWNQAELLASANPEANRILQAIRARFPYAQKPAITLAAYLCPISRFPTPSALARYLGLQPRHAESGKIKKPLKPTKEGSTVARTAIVQLAMARTNDITFQRIKRSDPRRHYIALIAEARKIAMQLWQDANAGITPEKKPNREEKRLEKQERVLQLVRQGLSDAEIHRLTGIHASIVSRWKRNDPTFAEQYTQAKIEAIYRDNPHSFAPEGDNPYSFEPEPDNPHSFDPEPIPPDP